MKVRRELRTLEQARALRRSSAAVARSQRRHLRPGPYVYGGGALWRHWREPVPDHLRRTKGSRRWFERGLRPRLRARLLAERLLAVLGPGVVWVSRRSSADGYPLVVAAARGDGVLIDPAGQQVARVFAHRRIAPEQVELRRRWAAHVPSPGFEVRQDGRMLVEEYVEGDHPDALAPAAQRELVRRVFRAYTELVHSEAQGSCRPITEALLDAADRGALPSVLVDQLRDRALLEATCTWPQVPAPGTVFSGNHIVGAGPTPIVIDCMPLDLRPFFSIPIETIASWSRTMPHLLPAYLAGEFDEELTGILAGADITGVTLRADTRRALLAYSVAVAWGGFDAAFVRGETGVTAAGGHVADRLRRYGLEHGAAWSP